MYTPTTTTTLTNLLRPRQGDGKANPTVGTTSTPNSSSSTSHKSSSAAGITIAIFIILVILFSAGWVLYQRIRARRLGIPPPPLNPFSDRNRIPGSGRGGPLGWLKSQFSTMSRGRRAGGAYEGQALGSGLGGSGGVGGARGGRASNFRGLDPDEAWDERVGTEADLYDEGDAGTGGYDGLSNQAPRGYNTHGENEYGGGRSELDERYDQEMGRGGGRGVQQNPFADPDGEDGVGLRSLSPKPEDLERGRGSHKSVFREGSMH